VCVYLANCIPFKGLFVSHRKIKQIWINVRHFENNGEVSCVIKEKDDVLKKRKK
jgi:hypothetical protein